MVRPELHLLLQIVHGLRADDRDVERIAVVDAGPRLGDILKVNIDRVSGRALELGHRGLQRSGFDETAEALYLTSGFIYESAAQAEAAFKDEVERYGHYSLAAESMYDHPFQWGSKRTGPDLARVGGKYSNEWHVAHMVDPRSVVPESIMPSYPFLADR